MRRLVWVAVGAVGGILAYRKAHEVLADAREQGVVLSAQRAGQSAANAMNAARAMAAGAAAAADPRTSKAPTAPGAAAARVLTQQQGD